jgi:RNA polymerase sigma-70 factor (ECF subfamily)
MGGPILNGVGHAHGVPTITASHPSTATADDAALVARVLAGERDVFRVLVERESRSVIQACYRVLGDLSEAEDVAQEAFVMAFRSLGSWRADGPFGAWLRRIAVRMALRAASSRRTVGWVDPAVSEPHPDRLVGAAVATARRADDPARGAIERERQARIRAAVANLDEPYREVVALRFFADLALAEIAQQTDRPLGTVKTHLHRGLERLRRELGPEGLA